MNERDESFDDEPFDEFGGPDNFEPDEFEPEFGIISRVEIPTSFHSVEHDGPFTKCLMCNGELVANGKDYMIEKVYRGTEVILELAMCTDCREGCGKSMSVESMEAIQKYFESNLDAETRIRELYHAPSANTNNVDAWIETCVLKGKSIDDLREYQVIAYCNGNELIKGFFPIMISGDAVEEISELLSEQSKGWMDDFVGDNFGMPSEFLDPSFRPVLL